jgi:hypothetical protein
MGNESGADFRYVKRWTNGRAEVEIRGQRFILVHRAMGLLGPMFYVAMQDGKDIGRPYKRLSSLLRALGR